MSAPFGATGYQYFNCEYSPLVACIGRSTTNSMRRIPIAPADRLCVFVVAADVLPATTGEIRDRRENTAREHAAFDRREPELDLVEPGRVGRREVNLHV